MRCGNLLALAASAVALMAVGGCQTAGPNSIGMGRERYNNILQSTAMEQTMSNIVRVYNHEPPMFMDVTEVDATLSLGGSLTGATTNIGAKRGASGGTLAGQVGSAGGTVQYSETPTVRYQPLLGQALVAQLVTPVSVDALGLMYDSSWDAGALLDLSSAYLTLDYREFYPALNTIIELNHRGALELVAAKSPLPGSAEPDESITSSSAPGTKGSAKSASANNDALMLYLRPFRQYAGSEDLKDMQRVLQLWVRMFRIYLGTQPSFSSSPDCATIGLAMDKDQLSKWDVGIDNYISGSDSEKIAMLNKARNCLPTTIELRVVPLPASTTIPSRAPLMRTYSALGILKNATERPGPKIEFVTPQQYDQIRGEPWNEDVDSLTYYTLVASDLDSVNCPSARKPSGGCDNPLPASKRELFRDGRLERWIQNSAATDASPGAGARNPPELSYPSGLDVYEIDNKDVLSSDFIDMNGRLGTMRRYILVIVDDHRPTVPVYVACTDGLKWYYIAKDDTVSEKNFQLLSLFMTMMAVPPATQPLSPVINVGG
jgi:hypothetical protein